MEEYGRIRRAHRDGMSIREIAREFHHSRYKVREVLPAGVRRRYAVPEFLSPPGGGLPQGYW